jgi:CheY-like chemotaxis protein
MIRYVLQLGLGVLLLGATLTAVVAQDKGKDFDLDEFRRLRRLETPLDHWNAVQFELDLGKPDIAARYLRGLMAKKPTDKDLWTILDRDGLTAILKLRNVRIWSADKKDQAQSQKDVEDLITQATEANRRRLADEKRIRELISQLRATPEEKTYAVGELFKIGAAAVPVMVDVHIRGKDPAERLAIVQALEKMGPATIPPLLAALDSDSTALKLDILDVLRKRHSRYGQEMVPFLWYPSAAKGEPESVRKKAAALLAEFLDLPAVRLQPAKVALTREAERYYQHQVTFGDPRAVTVWRWEGKGLVQGWPGSPTVTATQAEEYYGLRFARQALLLDPDYPPAQMVSLNLAVDKAMDRGGPTAPLSRTAPAVAELLTTASPDLLIDMLEKAMKDKRTHVALAVVRALGERAERRAKRPSRGGEPPLVRALYSSDSRLSYTAAVALVNIPGDPGPKTATRIVEVLARALSPAAAYYPGRKILVAVADENMRDRIGQAVTDVGARPILVTNGKDALRQLKASPEIEAVLLDSSLPYPGLPYLLAQLRQDVDLARVPILLAAVPETRSSHDAAVRFRELKTRVASIQEGTRVYRSVLRGIDAEEAEEKKEIEKEFAKDKRLSADEKLTSYRRAEEKAQAKRTQVVYDFPAAATLSKEIPVLEKEMARQVERYDLESQIREASLTRYLARCKYENVRVVHTSALFDNRSLETMLLSSVGDLGTPISAAERKELADQAMEILANLAEGKPAGYDVRPVAKTIFEALKAGALSKEAQLAGVRAVVRLDGEGAQQTLVSVILNNKRDPAVRQAAARALVVNAQRQGALLSGGDIGSLRALAGQPGVDPTLKDQLNTLISTLRPGERKTGERLRDYRPTPVPALPPPKGKEKEKDKEKDKDADK